MAQAGRILVLLVMLVLSGGELVRSARAIGTEWRILEARLAVKRLAENTLRYYGGRRPPVGDAFWRAVGREPLRDPWGSAYALDLSSPKTFRWRSAGPDRVYGTQDDLSVELPFGDEVVHALTHPEIDDSHPRSRDAK